MAAEKRAEVTWRGDLTSGAGTIERVGSGMLGPLAVSWAARAGEEVMRADLTDLAEMEGVMRGVHCVVHLGAIVEIEAIAELT